MLGATDIISLGDCGIDIFLELDKDEAEVQYSVNHMEQHLVLPFATKIPASKMTKTIAGNACNVAVGARRLGMKSALVTTLGKDEEAKYMASGLWKEKVDTRYIKQDKRTNHSTVLNYGAERTIIVYHEPREYKLPVLAKAKFIYLTSMRAGWETIVDDLAKYLDKTGTKLAYNPGTYQLRAGPKASQTLLDRCEILFVNKEEAMQYTGRSAETPIDELLSQLHRYGPKIVVITDGPNGSYAADSTGQYQIGIIDVPVVERTGCGDSYATGFMIAQAHGKDVLESMRWGTFNASSVIQDIGPQAGLLTAHGLKEYEKKYEEFTAKELPPSKKQAKKLVIKM